MTDKQQLLDELREAGAKVDTALSAMPADALEHGRYENGWNARQILAHMASIEWTYPRLLDVARTAQAGGDASAAPTRPKAEASVSAVAPAATAPGGNPVDGYNNRQIEKRAGASITELLDEFRANRAALIDAIASADEELLTVKITSAGGARGPLSGVLRYVAVEHVLGHLRDIAGGDA